MPTLIQSAVVLALLGGCSGTPIVASADVVVDASRACPIPFVAGSWQRVYAPSESRYLNDHTLVFDEQAARWHLYGITNTGPGMPQAEVSLLHATAPSLNGPWSDEAPILTADAALNERVLWAPYVFQEMGGGGVHNGLLRFRHDVDRGVRRRGAGASRRDFERLLSMGSRRAVAGSCAPSGGRS